MDPLMELAQKRRLVVIEDAAQAIGAEYKGRRAGSMGQYGCLSFFPSKNLRAAGDGGMVLTNDAGRAEKLRRLRAHGSHPKYYHRFIGGNFRLDAAQAALVSVKLRHLDEWTSARHRNAARYDQLVAESGLQVASTTHCGGRSPFASPGSGSSTFANGVPQVYLPQVASDRHIFNQYVIPVRARDEVKAALGARGVGTEIYYPMPLHRQECFAYLGHAAGSFPESESAAEQTLALPIFPELTDEQARYVLDCIRAFLAPPVAGQREGSQIP